MRRSNDRMINETFNRHLGFLRKKMNEDMGEETIKKTNYYWLSPQGEFFKLEGSDDVAYLHGVVDIINKGEYGVKKDDRDGGLYLIDPETNDVMSDEQMYDVAYNKGWVSVALEVGTNNSELIFTYGRDNGQKVNSNQLASLKRLASDMGVELIDGNTYETLDEAVKGEEVIEKLKGAEVIDVFVDSDGKVHLRIKGVNSTQLFDAVLV